MSTKARSVGGKHPVFGVGLLIAALLMSAPAAADDAEDKARSHFRLGRAHYDNGDFVKAAAEFEAAFAASQKPALLYNVYLAYRDANDTANAARALREYLTKEKEVENRQQLEAKLRALEAALAAETAAAPTPAAPVASQPVEPSPAQASPPEPEPATAADFEATAEGGGEGVPVLPIVLMAGGGAMVVTSLITGAMASSAQGELEDGCPTRMSCDPSLADTKDSGETLALVTDVLLFGGIAVAGTGVALFLLGGDS
jgi:tetratricopeptide (TPR) repeat protein